MDNFQEKVAVVTGTSNPRGIGLAIAAELADLGCRLVLADLDGEGVAARAAEMKAAGYPALPVRTDMGDKASVEDLARTTYDHYGATHILVLNHVAPTGDPGHSLLSPDSTSWELHAGVNLLGVVYGIKVFVQRMMAGGEHCHILATTSGAGATGTMYGNGPYACTKAAITSLMECLYGQLRDVGADIVPTLIFPGVTDTFPSPEAGPMVVEMLRQHGCMAVLSPPSEVAASTVDAIRRDIFWANPDPQTDLRLTDGRHAETIAWANEIYRRRASALIERTPPDPYLWGPPSSYLESSPRRR
jgi:NAD(P)-dependent dehydrogenase (short-subunit alcohol dehydrogenase family)